MATTNVRLKDASGNVLHPETDWSVVQNKPSYLLSLQSNPFSQNLMDFGRVVVSNSSGAYVYFAVHCWSLVGNLNTYLYFSENGTAHTFVPKEGSYQYVSLYDIWPK